MPTAGGEKIREVRALDYIGNFKDTSVITVSEVLISPGQRIVAEDMLITLEIDIAVLMILSPHVGIANEVKVGVGDKVS